MKTRIYFLHGFLGEPADWAPVLQEISAEQPSFELVAVDFMRITELQPQQNRESLEAWGENFCRWVTADSEGCRRTIVGYSMGGRLALQALAAAPELWQGAVLLSTNPGLTSPAEKLLRLQSDEAWAARFDSEPFAAVLRDWNGQPVLAGSPQTPREHLADLSWSACLRQWSLGKQTNFRVQMETWPLRQIWAAGARDDKFVQLLKTLPSTSKIQKWTVGDAFHRLPMEAPQEVAHFAVRVSSPLRNQ